jgi:hypothetical protein
MRKLVSIGTFILSPEEEDTDMAEEMLNYLHTTYKPLYDTEDKICNANVCQDFNVWDKCMRCDSEHCQVYDKHGNYDFIPQSGIYFDDNGFIYDRYNQIVKPDGIEIISSGNPEYHAGQKIFDNWENVLYNIESNNKWYSKYGEVWYYYQIEARALVHDTEATDEEDILYTIHGNRLILSTDPAENVEYTDRDEETLILELIAETLQPRGIVIPPKGIKLHLEYMDQDYKLNEWLAHLRFIKKYKEVV